MGVFGTCSEKHPDSGDFGFAKFFCSIENVLYYITMFIGLYTLYKVQKESHLYEQPFDDE